ncbi:hypothetical protein [Paenibacillus sonchi]|uniref:hypothetical protein n=1 Tax=Paenibacillus sonchi TaxID=373687 RepID=UPI001E4C370A|nr:hypothetical protein [Paenibacillus sonchi]MCE3203503.1 hypothetical protein [Paenibacillus sonchi]
MRRMLRLNVKELSKAQIDNDIPNDTELSKIIGVSTTQLWRAKLSPYDNRYNAPGNFFIAGVLHAFGGPIEKFFYVDDVEKKRGEQRELTGDTSCN